MINNTRKMQGFTLVEVMVVAAVIGILAAIVYPSYQEYVQRSNRSEGMAFLNDAAARQERYLSQNNAFAKSAAQLGYSSSSSPTGLYTLGVSSTAATAYSLTATPARTDAKCGVLSLTHAGVKGKTGTASAVADCWK
jgi:type IV pilus assembly protein PilE